MRIDSCLMIRKSIRTALVMLVAVLPLVMWSAAFSEGYCGDNVTWTLSSAGVLTISGTGNLSYFESHGAPWYDQRYNIRSVVVKNGVKWLESYFLEDCENLTSLTLGKSVCGFGNDCIVNCPGLTELTIPGEIEMRGLPIIRQCPNLTVYCKKAAYDLFPSLRAGNVAFVVTDADSNFLIRDNELIGYIGNAKKLVIPSGVKEIGFEACSYLQNTEEIILPDSVESISNMAFECCTKLRRIKMPESLTWLGPGVFTGCTSLESITIPEGIRSLDYIFTDCTGLRTISLPVSITAIDDFLFYTCSNLETVYYGGSETDRNRMYIGEYNDPLVNAEWIYGSEGSSGGNRYCGNNVTWTLSSAGVLTISGTGNLSYFESHRAPWYDQRNNIRSAVVENGVEWLESHFLEDCENLTSLTLGKSVCGFSTDCIVNCPGLTELTIPGEIGMEGIPCIRECPNLTVYCKKAAYDLFPSLRAGNVAFVVTDADSDFLIRDNELIGYIGNAKKLVIPSGVKEIGYDACSYLHDTEEIILPDSVENISNMAFEYCTKLRRIKMPESLTRLGPAVFTGCTSLESITIPDGIRSLDSSLLYDCTGLRTLFLPVSITAIEEWMFYTCSNLETVYYGGSETDRNRMYIGEYNDPLVNAEWIYGFDLSKVIIIPSRATVIEQEAFYGNRAAVVRINKKCTAIGSRAFGNCRSLVEIHIPASVVNIADDFLEGSSNAVIYCQEGSKAAQWADAHSWRKVVE